jgi:hypothetical protein
MSTQSKFTAVALALACLAAPATAAEYDFDGALQSLRTHRMVEAYGRFLSLGLQGDPDAARVALFLGQNATILYGAMWELTDLDAASLRVVVAGRPSLRPQPQPDPAGYDATGISQRPIPTDTIAGR